MKHHLREIIDRKVSIHINCNGIYFPNCRLMFMRGRQNVLGLVVGNGSFVAGDRIAVSYVFGPYMHTFTTNVAGFEADSSGNYVLHVCYPDKIAQLERRKWDRVKPSEKHPIRIKLLLQNNETIEVSAADISQNGVCFFIPSAINYFNIGSRVSMTISFPIFGSIEAAGTVRNLTEFSGVIKCGAEFDSAQEFDSLLAQYVHLRRIEIHAKNQLGTRSKKESILVIIKDSDQGKHAFMCSDSPVSRVDDFDSFSEILSVDVIDFLEDEQKDRTCPQI